MRLPASLHALAESLAKLPSIGPRQAIRLALHISTLAPDRASILLDQLGNALRITRCTICDFPFDGDGTHCAICSDDERTNSVLMVVEKETDLLSMEKVGRYNGRYLITGTLPRSGQFTDKQQTLIARVLSSAPQEGYSEVILAVAATPHGELLAQQVTAHLKEHTKKITRLGRGLPRGGEVEFADEDTLGYSLDNRG
jgi:recombination protein RecR